MTNSRLGIPFQSLLLTIAAVCIQLGIRISERGKTIAKLELKKIVISYIYIYIQKIQKTYVFVFFFGNPKGQMSDFELSLLQFCGGKNAKSKNPYMVIDLLT